MRSAIKVGMAALIAGATMAGAASVALAGADDGGSHAFWMESTSSNPATVDTKRDSKRYTAKYAPESAVQSKAATPEKDPPNFYHAQGTMGVP